MNIFPTPPRPSFQIVFVWATLLVFGSSWVWAQANIPYQRLLVLVAGPSGDRIHPEQQAVVAHLNSVRSEYGLGALQMGTMHYDRPAEAEILEGVLGFSRYRGVTVGLVELDNRGVPVRTLYKMENVTKGSLEAGQADLLNRWSQISGEALPAIKAATQQPPTLGPPRETYSFEGIRAVITELDDKAQFLWREVRNAPLRADGQDEEVRRQTRDLAEGMEALKAASDRGVIFPIYELEEVVRIGYDWEDSEPQYFLPVPLRGEVRRVLTLLEQTEDILKQGLLDGR